MFNTRLILCAAAIAALVSVSACSSHGRVGFGGGGLTASNDDNGNDDNGDDDGTPDTPPSEPDCCNGHPGHGGHPPGGPVLASAGNLVSDLLHGGGDGGSPTQALDPLGRVTVGNHTLIGDANGEGAPAIGLNVASNGQTEGQLATLGVLNNGQIVAANSIGPAGSPDLIGANVGGQQVIGQGNSQQIGLGVLAPSNTQGNVASVNLLTGGNIVDIQVPGSTGSPTSPTGVVKGVTNTLGAVLGGHH